MLSAHPASHLVCLILWIWVEINLTSINLAKNRCYETRLKTRLKWISIKQFVLCVHKSASSSQYIYIIPLSCLHYEISSTISFKQNWNKSPDSLEFCLKKNISLFFFCPGVPPTLRFRCCQTNWQNRIYEYFLSPFYWHKIDISKRPLHPTPLPRPTLNK